MTFNPRKARPHRQSLNPVIPREKYRAMRKRVLEHLQRQQAEEGWNNFSEGWLDSGSWFSDLHPFAGMSRCARESAVKTFWDSLVNARLVERTDLMGHVYYHLPGTSPIPASMVDLVTSQLRVSDIPRIVEAMMQQRELREQREKAQEAKESPDGA